MNPINTELVYSYINYIDDPNCLPTTLLSVIPQSWYDKFSKCYNSCPFECISGELLLMWEDGKLEPNIIEFATALLYKLLSVTDLKNMGVDKYPENHMFLYLINPGLFPIYEFLNGVFKISNVYVNIDISIIYHKYGYEFTKLVIEKEVPIIYGFKCLISEVCKNNDIITFRYLTSGCIEFNNYDRVRIFYRYPDVGAFTYACANGNMEMINLLLNRSRDVIEESIKPSANCNLVYGLNAGMQNQNQNKYSPIIVACIKNQLEVFNLLVSYIPKYQMMRINLSGFNLANLAILSMNEDLVEYIMKTYDLKIDDKFIYKICSNCTLDIFVFALRYFDQVDTQELLKVARDNIPISEYILHHSENLTNLSTNFLTNLSPRLFFDLMLSKSILVQKEVFKNNSHYFDGINQITYEIEPGNYNYYTMTPEFVKDVIKNINETDERITIVIYKPDKYHRFDLDREDYDSEDEFEEVLEKEDLEEKEKFVVIFRVNNKYIIGHSHDYYCKSDFLDTLRILDIPKNNDLIETWAIEFVEAKNRTIYLS